MTDFKNAPFTSDTLLPTFGTAMLDVGVTAQAVDDSLAKHMLAMAGAARLPIPVLAPTAVETQLERFRLALELSKEREHAALARVREADAVRRGDNAPRRRSVVRRSGGGRSSTFSGAPSVDQAAKIVQLRADNAKLKRNIAAEHRGFRVHALYNKNMNEHSRTGYASAGGKGWSTTRGFGVYKFKIKIFTYKGDTLFHLTHYWDVAEDDFVLLEGGDQFLKHTHDVFSTEKEAIDQREDFAPYKKRRRNNRPKY